MAFISHVDILYLSLALLGICGIPIIRWVMERSDNLKKGKKLGPNYWGRYAGSCPVESPSELKIVGREPAAEDIISIGWQN